jgi:hypothetical protein
LCLSSSSFCHRWRRETDPNLSDPRLITSLGVRLILISLSPWLDLTTTKRISGWRKLFHDDDTISTLMSPFGNLILHVAVSRKLLKS